MLKALQHVSSIQALYFVCKCSLSNIYTPMNTLGATRDCGYCQKCPVSHQSSTTVGATVQCEQNE